MASNTSANGWGWLGLITVVALIGAGFLYQREGGRLFGPDKERLPPDAGEPQPTVAKGTKAAPKPPVSDSATLAVSLTMLGNQEFGPWLYLNQKLHKDYTGRRRECLSIVETIGSEKRFELAALEMQKKYPGESYSLTRDERGNIIFGIKDTIALPAGEYGIELATAGFNPSDQSETYNKPDSLRFPLKLETLRGSLDAGQVTSAAFAPLPYRIARFPSPGNMRGYGQICILGELFFEKRHVDAYRNLVKENWERYQKEPVRLALEKIQNETPKGRAIMTPLPEAFYGARELTGPQIELIADWLKDVYAPILVIGPQRSSDPDDPGFAFWRGNLDAVKREALQLMEDVDRHREAIDELKAICRKLLQAPHAN